MHKHIASISYGKDSLAMLEVMKQNNMPIDKIVHVELMATDTIPADYPDIMNWKRYADERILQRYGLEVEHVTANTNYEKLFYSIPKRKEKNRHREGTILGFPSLRSQWCSRSLKVQVMQDLFKGDCIQYIGIASDEPKRFGQLNEKVRSPLAEHGITEPMAYQICKDLDLLAPSYLQSKRSGCWFCHAQPIAQLRLLRQQHPDLWNILLAWDKDSPIPFRHGKRHGDHSVHDFERRFKLEDKGVLKANDCSFRWARMDEYERQTTF